MKIGPAKAEGAHAGASRDTRRDLPVFTGQLKAEVAPIERELGVRCRDPQRRGQDLVMKGERDFGQRGRAGGGLQVADVALDAPQGGAVTGLTDDVDQRVHLDGVTDGCPGSVGLEVGDRLGIDRGVIVGALDGAALACGVGGGDPLAAAIARGTDALDHCVDLTTLGLGVLAPHQDHHSGAFAHHEAVGSGVEGTRGVRGEGADLGELHVTFDTHAGV